MKKVSGGEISVDFSLRGYGARFVFENRTGKGKKILEINALCRDSNGLDRIKVGKFGLGEGGCL